MNNAPTMRRIRTDYCPVTDSLTIKRRDATGNESTEVKPAYIASLKLAVEAVKQTTYRS